MKKIALLISVVMVFTATAGCQAGTNAPSAPTSTPELKQIFSSGKKTIVFFLNPQGGPCRAQNEVLMKLLQDKKGSFNVAYVSTLKTEDQKAFYDYGVRNLPTLVLVDNKGKLQRNFPPGIQSYEALASALDGVN